MFLEMLPLSWVRPLLRVFFWLEPAVLQSSRVLLHPIWGCHQLSGTQPGPQAFHSIFQALVQRESSKLQDIWRRMEWLRGVLLGDLQKNELNDQNIFYIKEETHTFQSSGKVARSKKLKLHLLLCCISKINFILIQPKLGKWMIISRLTNHKRRKQQ